jgi:ketopantoate reductase
MREVVAAANAEGVRLDAAEIERALAFVQVCRQSGRAR